MRKASLCLLTALAISTAGAAMATPVPSINQPGFKPHYFGTAAIGAAIPSGDWGNTIPLRPNQNYIEKSAGVDTGFDVTLDLGYQFTENLGLQLNFLIANNSMNTKQLPNGDHAKSDQSSQLVTITLDGLYTFDIPNSKISPYVGVGVGISDGNLFDQDTNTVYYTDKRQMALHGLVGFEYHINPRLDAIAGYDYYRYSYNDMPLTGHSTTTPSMNTVNVGVIAKF